MKKILLVIGDAAELLDTMYPYFRIREDGHQVIVAGPERRVYHLVQHEKPDDWDITRETAGYHLAADLAFRDIDPADYAGMVLSGGRAPEFSAMTRTCCGRCVSCTSKAGRSRRSATASKSWRRRASFAARKSRR